jgi:hypothetical protein
MRLLRPILILSALFSQSMQLFDGILNKKIMLYWIDNLYTEKVLYLSDRGIKVISVDSFAELFDACQIHLGYLMFY